MNLGKKSISILDITLIALFAALCYVSLMVLFVPFAGMFIHVGNLLLVLAALLCGGIQGGLAGAIGMGLFDLLNGHADSVPKTLILKLLIGLAVGIAFKFFSKRSKIIWKSFFAISMASFIVSLSLLVYSFVTYEKFGGKSAVLCLCFFGLFLVFALLFSFKKKIDPIVISAFLAATIGMTVNIIGEFAWKFVYYLLLGNVPQAALTTATLAQGSTLINAVIAIIGGVTLFLILKKPFFKITQR
ncbi:MAG: ECF transporter S component [Oscillospiraceae bacterium]